MLTVKQLLTFGLCIALLLPIFVFDAFVGSVLGGIADNFGILLVLAASLLAFLFSGVLTFGGVLPWCRINGRTANNFLDRASGVAAALTVGISLYLYSSITFWDKAPRKFQFTKIGMTKTQVVQLVGRPDWQEGQSLWAYRIRGDGIGGILVPYYFSFDANGLLESVHS